MSHLWSMAGGCEEVLVRGMAVPADVVDGDVLIVPGPT